MDEPVAQHPLLDASCRVALAAYLHDLGKFAERARLEVPPDRLDTHLTQYCPYHEAGGRGWHSHRHAAYTALAWDLIERRFPELVGRDIAPFAAWNAPDVDDSIVNAASRHHKPETYLQWLVATADRVASGFEREAFDEYNRSKDQTREGRNHFTARQLTLFEQVAAGTDRGRVRRQDLHYRYPLQPLSVQAIFPVAAAGYETADNTVAQREYARLWDAFRGALDAIPASHRGNWPLWLDHFDSAWACYTQAIPSATAFGTRPDVSLYDHSRTTAALATALWRYHHDRDDDRAQVRARLADWHRPDWDEPKLLLIQGDLFGIQEFIFASGGETQKRAARLLRGRSFYVSLLTECAALRILDTLGLPPTSQVINAAGKFLIVAPNTDETVAALQRVQRELDAWFLEHCFGESGIGLAWLPACCNDFLRRKDAAEAPFQRLIKRLFEVLQQAKARRFDLCGACAPAPLFEGFLDRFDPELGVCEIDGRAPATRRENGVAVSRLAADQIAVGRHLAGKQRLLITRDSLDHNTLELPVFGYAVQFTGGDDQTGRFGMAARNGNLRRAWDFSLPEREDTPLFSGYARRFINGYVPRFGSQNEWEQGRYQRLPAELREGLEPQAPKTLEHLACDDREPDAAGNYRGIEALVTLKGDVDNLGAIFETGLEPPTFAKMAALSRQMNAFFAIWLPWHCQQKRTSAYTVFAGGDDFFLIGPWRSTMQLAREMRREFARYVAGNPGIHFSAGLAMTKPGLPIRQMGALADEALEQAKARQNQAGEYVKDALTCFGYTVSWDDWETLWGLHDELAAASGEIALSTSYLYGLHGLADMAGRLQRGEGRIEDALWNSRFVYRTRRMLEQHRGMSPAARNLWQQRLGTLLGGGIQRFGSTFKLALFPYLYQHRY
ncbi:CRISPR-associated protein, Csm1 family [Thioalkalivibrio nitratireducens DSM 14787]|uniref:CRISPR system single-strand-specific deoxyribonuclease Cas10/Csm1 (subtype III-A) n=1 Tax=Thioalkalivibrio nitratireducens (strain DSM 14787 / UNIQEM 213 / ALEN2) TaxID=1255043 RepID=L0DU54_THIND|nr:type III-A CRISPR-associated protein Cas10/Csm1 [Thioalkalivibrio nitratireducens]AGA33129.1 CRISPR-associated protein, Csm1 family [Thioalkalivibrio nitratireducens DSM 14787]